MSSSFKPSLYTSVRSVLITSTKGSGIFFQFSGSILFIFIGRDVFDIPCIHEHICIDGFPPLWKSFEDLFYGESFWGELSSYI